MQSPLVMAKGMYLHSSDNERCPREDWCSFKMRPRTNGRLTGVCVKRSFAECYVQRNLSRRTQEIDSALEETDHNRTCIGRKACADAFSVYEVADTSWV